MRSLFLPRPLMILANGLQFGAGLLFALLEGAAVGTRSWTLFAGFVLVWFLVQEFLVQQAKYMWNDLRDREHDQDHPANVKRPVVQVGQTEILYLVLAIRWGLGLLLAWTISPDLLVIVVFTSLLQVFYEYVAKPRAKKVPLLSLLAVAVSAVLKFSGGALAAGWQSSDQRFWLYALAMFATGVVYVSSYWRVEAKFFAGQGLEPARGQSVYFQQNGLNWLYAGALAGIGACWLLFLDAYCNFLGDTAVSTPAALLIICTAGVVCCLVAYGVVRYKARLKHLLAPAIFSGWLMVGVNGESLYGLFPHTAAAPLLFMLFLMIDYRANFGMDYKQQNLIYLQENWPGLKRVLREWRRPLVLGRKIWKLNTAVGWNADKKEIN